MNDKIRCIFALKPEKQGVAKVVGAGQRSYHIGRNRTDVQLEGMSASGVDTSSQAVALHAIY